MLTEKQLDRYADVLLWGLRTARKGRIKKGEIVLLRYDLPAVALAEILFDKLCETGANPIQRVGTTPKMETSFYAHANPRQLVFRPPGEEAFYQQLNGSIYLHAPASLTHLTDTDPKKIAKATIAQKYLRDIMDHRESSGLFSWTLCLYPTEALAHHAHLPVKEYSKQVVSACFLNRVDPVAMWQEVYAAAQSVKKWLNSLKVSYFHVQSKHIDLKITPGDKRQWIGISGHNIPSFEIFLSPDWRGTTGVYFANQPSFRTGNYITDVRMEFKKGDAVNISASSGEAFVKKQLSMDKGARRVGEFSLTDKRFSKISKFMANTLYDENYGGKFGNCHLAVGSSYADTFAGNTKNLTPKLKQELGFNTSALHWDLVNTEKKNVVAHLTNGRNIVIYENGKFAY